MRLKAIMVLLLLVGTALVGAEVRADRIPPDIVKGSTIIGKGVENLQGKHLGEIQDLAIDEVDGQIRYAVLSFGGLLGMGEKYFAIPWEALELSQDRRHFVLDVSEEDLKHAPGFDKGHWPDFVDPVYYSMIYEFYHIPLPGEREPAGAVGSPDTGGRTKNGERSGRE